MANDTSALAGVRPDEHTAAGMGAVAECFARSPGVVHSGHPAVEFIAQGARATEVMGVHELAAGLGNTSPLARLETARADIVLIGVGHVDNTALHLAESRALGPAAPMIRDGVPMVLDGQRSWVEYSHIDFDDSDFAVGWIVEHRQQPSGTHL